MNKYCSIFVVYILVLSFLVRVIWGITTSAKTAEHRAKMHQCQLFQGKSHNAILFSAPLSGKWMVTGPHGDSGPPVPQTVLKD